MKQGSAKARPLCGAAAVAALVAAVALSSCGGGPGGPQPIPTGGHAMGAMAQLVLDGMTAEQALAAQGYATATQADVPPWFDAEVLPASRCEGCFAAEDWQVVGLRCRARPTRCSIRCWPTWPNAGGAPMRAASTMPLR